MTSENLEDLLAKKMGELLGSGSKKASAAWDAVQKDFNLNVTGLDRGVDWILGSSHGTVLIHPTSGEVVKISEYHAEAWTPDGEGILFTDYLKGSARGSILSGSHVLFRASLDGELELLNEYVVTGFEMVHDADLKWWGLIRNPVYSPDGKKILFNRLKSEFLADLYVMNSDGTGMNKVVDNIRQYLSREFGWTDDGGMYYVAGEGLILSGRAGDGYHRVPYGTQPSFGKQLVFVNHAGMEKSDLLAYPEIKRESGLVRLDQDGRIVQLGLELGYPAASPDGRFVAASSDMFRTEENPMFKIIGMDGQEFYRREGAYNCYDSVWSPDSKKVAYSFPLKKFIHDRRFVPDVEVNCDDTNDTIVLKQWRPHVT